MACQGLCAGWMTDMTCEEHEKRLTHVVSRLEGFGMTLNSEKCQFTQSSVKFLGHVVDYSGIRTDPSKVSPIRNVPEPENVGVVRRFLGMANQLSTSAPHLAEITKPLRELLVKDNAWVWVDA